LKVAVSLECEFNETSWKEGWRRKFPKIESKGGSLESVTGALELSLRQECKSLE
jgi:hypothetical protein